MIGEVRDALNRAASLSMNSLDFTRQHSESSNGQSRDPTASGLHHFGGGGSSDHMKPIFVDAAAMKERVRQQLCKPTHNVADFYKESGWAQLIARSSWFEQVTLVIIAFNAVWISVDTDHNEKEILVEAHPVFQVAEHFFCAFFTLEWLVRFAAFEKKCDGLRDRWFAFDSTLVSMMVVETWVMTAVALLAGSPGGGGLGNASILRVARLLRLTRMARMARLLRAMPELMILVKGMAAAMRSVFFTLFLLVIIMYVFAIAFTQLTADSKLEKDFRTVPDAMYTLLLYGTLLDDVGSLARRLGEEGPQYSIMFFLFVLLAALTLMNMLIGVLCEVVSAVAATEREEMLVGYVNRKVRQIVEELDKDGGGSISKDEFAHILENRDAIGALQDVGVDVVGLVDFADVIFEDQEELSFSKFMEVVLQLRGSNTATVKDIVDLRKLVSGKFKEFVAQRRASRRTHMQQVQATLESLQSSVLRDAVRKQSNGALRTTSHKSLVAASPKGEDNAEGGALVRQLSPDQAMSNQVAQWSAEVFAEAPSFIWPASCSEHAEFLRELSEDSGCSLLGNGQRDVRPACTGGLDEHSNGVVSNSRISGQWVACDGQNHQKLLRTSLQDGLLAPRLHGNNPSGQVVQLAGANGHWIQPSGKLSPLQAPQNGEEVGLPGLAHQLLTFRGQMLALSDNITTALLDVNRIREEIGAAVGTSRVPVAGASGGKA